MIHPINFAIIIELKGDTMEYKVGYIKIQYDDGDWSQWTAGIMYGDILQYYNANEDVIITRNGSNVHEMFALSPSGCSVFLMKKEALECFEVTIKVVKQKEKKRKRENKKQLKWWGMTFFWIYMLLMAFVILIKILEANGIINKISYR